MRQVTAPRRCAAGSQPEVDSYDDVFRFEPPPQIVLVERNGQRLFDPVQYQQQLRVYLERQQIAETRPCNQADSAWCATHTVSLSLLDCPTAGMAGVACSEQCTAAELTVGKRCLVVIALDSQALVIATY